MRRVHRNLIVHARASGEVDDGTEELEVSSADESLDEKPYDELAAAIAEIEADRINRLRALGIEAQ